MPRCHTASLPQLGHSTDASSGSSRPVAASLTAPPPPFLHNSLALRLFPLHHIVKAEKAGCFVADRATQRAALLYQITPDTVVFTKVPVVENWHLNYLYQFSTYIVLSSSPNCYLKHHDFKRSSSQQTMLFCPYLAPLPMSGSVNHE